MNLNVDIFTEFNEKWALLTAGTAQKFNAMTVSWGAMGTTWSKPTVTVYVRHSRYTYDFMEQNEIFTVSTYYEEMRPDLTIMGRTSGRDGDKLAKTSLVPVELACGAMTFKQAKRTLVCRKLFAQDLNLENLKPELQEKHYPTKDIHRMYIAEVLEIIE